MPVNTDFIKSHYEGGLFGGLCLDNGLISAIPRQPRDLWSILPRGQGIITPVTEYGIVTGIGANTEVPAVNDCDPPRWTNGDAHMCTLRMDMGKMSFRTKIFDIKQKFVVEACGVRPPVLMRGTGTNTDAHWVPNLGAAANTTGANLSDPAVKALIELYTGMFRLWAPLAWNGTGAVIDASFTEPVGLANQIRDGIIDVFGDPCPQADSLVRDFGGVDICTDPVAGYSQIVYMYRSLNARAESYGLAPLVLVPFMRRALFHQLTDLWPCINATAKCARPPLFSADTSPIRTFRDTAQEALDMRAGQYLWIDGEQVPVILDETIPETAPVGGGTLWTSDIYFVPLVLGDGRAGVFVDWYNWNSPLGLGSAGFQELAARWVPHSVLDQGRFLVTRRLIGDGCVSSSIYSCPRILLIATMLAGRIDDVGYEYTYERVQWDDTQPDFLPIGGRASRP